MRSPSVIELTPAVDKQVPGLLDQHLSLQAFSQIAGKLAGYPFVKTVVDREKSQVHFINHSAYEFHADYIAEQILRIPVSEMEKNLDAYNKSFYADPERRFFLGIIALHQFDSRMFFSLETVEVDTMDLGMLKQFYNIIKVHVDPPIPLLLKPANHRQEAMLADVDPVELPRIYAHEIYASATFVALNRGVACGRLRVFQTQEQYQSERQSMQWYDIVVMPKVPDDIPRVSGIINSEHTTPLSHTNVLASGWQVPNSIQIGIMERIEADGLAGQWVEYSVEPNADRISLRKIERPSEIDHPPHWCSTKVRIDEPEVSDMRILKLDELRAADRTRFGTKAANLGEIHHVLRHGSHRLLGFYEIRRPPRENLLPYLAKLLEQPENSDLERPAHAFLSDLIKIPRGIAIPFSFQQRFLESSPRIQQAIGKLKMALELDARQVESLCVDLQHMIISTKLPASLADEIDYQISRRLGGVSSFVVRSSSNAEDLENFSAAGIYESVNHVTAAHKIFESIKRVWASIVSPRSVRLRQGVGISLDDVYMGVIIQEEVQSEIGGVLVTTNPVNRTDFRNVYINLSRRSAVQVVQGTELPSQYLYNTVEGGGRTLSIGSATEDVSARHKDALQRLALAGRLLQSHFSPDYTFANPVDIEWAINSESAFILQLRPYAT